MNWYLISLSKLLDFKGRSHRTEFWLFILVAMVIGLLLGLLDRYLGTYDEALKVGLLDAIYTFLMLLPSLAVGCRRLHDIGRSGWWQLFYLTIIGVVFLIYWWIQIGDRDANTYGENPADERGQL